MDLHDFDTALRSNDSPSSEELGGPVVMRQLASKFVKSGHADRLANALCRTRDMRPDYLKFVSEVLRDNPFPLVVASVAENLAAADLTRREVMSAQDILLARARQTDTQIDNDMASECLAAAFLLAAETGASQSALVAALERTEPGDSSLLVRRVALLAGLAWHWNQSADLEMLLERLAADTDSGEQAAFELGMIQIDRALSSEDRESLFERLEGAAKWFEVGIDIDPEMPETRALGNVVRALVLFCDEASTESIEHHVEIACDAASERFQFLDKQSLRKWLRPRLDAQSAWYELAGALRGLSSYMSERSWLRALPVLQQISILRSTLVSLATDSGDALRDAVTNRLAAGFAAREGLRAHLQAWIADVQTDDANRLYAVTLLSAVDLLRTDQGKATPLASNGGLAGGIEADATTEVAAAMLRAIQPAPFGKPQEQCYLQLVSKLQSHGEYHGSVEDDVNACISFQIRFLSLCLDISAEMAKPTFQFLFESDGTLPLEKDLQIAMFQWMRLAMPRFGSHQIRREAHDVSRGRADLAIICTAWLMTIELKRESSDASREGVSKYLGQAASYTLTGAGFGFLVVLDLCSQKDWPLRLADNCWVESVQGPRDSQPRMIVVFRIPGMRPVPSSILTPGSKRKVKSRSPTRESTKSKSSSS
ncbi:hypothetical protein [Paraburkholderia phenoliruptrix]|uniref:hypothetical protein n=1 Tax=Paraburkholderia phenoliruptrix TaxID=252970 RepID=UPI0039B3E1E0